MAAILSRGHCPYVTCPISKASLRPQSSRQLEITELPVQISINQWKTNTQQDKLERYLLDTIDPWTKFDRNGKEKINFEFGTILLQMGFFHVNSLGHLILKNEFLQRKYNWKDWSYVPKHKSMQGTIGKFLYTRYEEITNVLHLSISRFCSGFRTVVMQ